LARNIRRKDVARPAPFTPEQVAALVAGEANQTVIGKVLAAHRQPRIPVRAVRRKGYPTEGAAPIPIAATDLRELTTGKTPEKVAKLLETTASQRSRRPGKARTSAVRPKRRPPLY